MIAETGVRAGHRWLAPNGLTMASRKKGRSEMVIRVQVKPGRDPEPPLKTNWSAVFFLVVWTAFGLLITHHTLT